MTEKITVDTVDFYGQHRLRNRLGRIIAGAFGKVVGTQNAATESEAEKLVQKIEEGPYIGVIRRPRR